MTASGHAGSTQATNRKRIATGAPASSRLRGWRELLGDRCAIPSVSPCGKGMASKPTQRAEAGASCRRRRSATFASQADLAFRIDGPVFAASGNRDGISASTALRCSSRALAASGHCVGAIEAIRPWTRWAGLGVFPGSAVRCHEIRSILPCFIDDGLDCEGVSAGTAFTVHTTCLVDHDVGLEDKILGGPSMSTYGSDGGVTAAQQGHGLAVASTGKIDGPEKFDSVCT